MELAQNQETRGSAAGGSEPVAPDAYRRVMRAWPSGVTIVTMLDGAVPHGMTASAFTSVSLDPPMVLVVVDRRWRSHALIESAGAFCVNILASDMSALADRFAGRHGEMADRFHDLRIGTAVSGAPHLSDAAGWLDCAVDRAIEAGDHTIFLGRVLACGTAAEAAAPLLYHDGDYAALAPRS